MAGIEDLNDALLKKALLQYIVAFPVFLMSHIFLPNCDVCYSFPLPDMLEAHRRYGGMGTILVIKVSDRINYGVYIFTPDIFTAIQGVSTQRKDKEPPEGVRVVRGDGGDEVIGDVKEEEDVGVAKARSTVV
ncbi:hypothetical protein L1049_012868 [Liquidambar formosana]|uniref:Uncharacterized protein n=1 Tax=Liquidambar formosana TaxID=63359 RepID=A0AAP0WXG8_LIQFO